MINLGESILVFVGAVKTARLCGWADSGPPHADVEHAYDHRLLMASQPHNFTRIKDGWKVWPPLGTQTQARNPNP